MTAEKVAEISGRYIELYERITGETFDAAAMAVSAEETLDRIVGFLRGMG